MKDNIFLTHDGSSFKFDENVATVFDDMISRSVPFYDEALRLSVEFVLKNTTEGDRVYDLGCSTASTLLEIYRKNHTLELIGVDNSTSMIAKAKQKVSAYGANIALHIDDILEIDLDNPKAVISNYTLQFISPDERLILIKKIYDSLKPNGIFIFSEKLISDNQEINEQMVDVYYDFKARQGYSEIEIVKKKEALENVLIPFTQQQNEAMLREAGFESVEIVFKWVNFTTFIAKKSS